MASNPETAGNSEAQRFWLHNWRELHQSVRNLTDALATLPFEQENLPDLTASIAALADMVGTREGDIDALVRALETLPSRGRVALPPLK